jgi:hypothetical protein
MRPVDGWFAQASGTTALPSARDACFAVQHFLEAPYERALLRSTYQVFAK